MHEEEPLIFLQRGQHNGLGADEFRHLLRRTLQVQVESHRGVPRDGPARDQFRCVEQRRQPRVEQQPIDARGACTLRALVRGEGVPPEGGCQFKVHIHEPADQEGRQD